jgi:hypothetical protein
LIMEQAAPASAASTAELLGEDRADPSIREPYQSSQRLGDYRIIREIGRGGMGIVYEAEQESLGRRVALKVLSRHMGVDAKHAKRFLREAKAAAGLHHTNIVPVFGVGEQDGTYYYVMQFIPGLPLDVVLDEVKRMRGRESPEQAKAWSTERDDNVATERMATRAVAQSLVTGAFQPCSVEPAVADAERPDSPGIDPAPQAEVETVATRTNRLRALPTSKASPVSATTSPTRWPTPIIKACCTVTSSRPTSCSTPPAAYG